MTRQRIIISATLLACLLGALLLSIHRAPDKPFRGHIKTFGTPEVASTDPSTLLEFLETHNLPLRRNTVTVAWFNPWQGTKTWPLDARNFPASLAAAGLPSNATVEDLLNALANSPCNPGDFFANDSTNVYLYLVRGNTIIAVFLLNPHWFNDAKMQELGSIQPLDANCSLMKAFAWELHQDRNMH